VSGAKRTVRLGSMSYIDPAGRVRWADRGAEVVVHGDHVARFDSLNVLAAAETSPAGPVEASVADSGDGVQVPKRRPRRSSTED